MGGRGSRSAGGGGNINAQWRQVFQPVWAQGTAPPPNVQPGQPVPAITIQQLQQMNDTEFVNYLSGLNNTPIDQNTYYNNTWDTQRLIANIPELNRAPQIADSQTFASLSGTTLYRTVNASGSETALDICSRTLTSDVTTIGEGVMGDGFYFATSKSASQSYYGNHKNNMRLTATMSAKLNGNAKIVSNTRLSNMLANESASVRNAVRGMRSGGSWSGNSGLMAYALRKGYNVVQRNDGVYNVIDRNAATWSGEISPVT